MSFLFCRLNSTDINREQTIYRSCEKLEFPAENLQIFCVNIRYLTYMYNSTLASLPQNLFKPSFNQ